MPQLPLPPGLGTLADAEVLTVEAFFHQWLSHAKGRVRAKTYDGYECLIRLYVLPRLGSVLLVEVRPLLIQRLYGDLLGRGLSGGTILNLHLVLTQAFAQATRWGLIPVNPVAGAQPPRPRRPEIAMVDPSLAERILAATSGTFFELPAAIAIATGMRRGEILALRWSDLDPDLGVVHVRRSLQTSGGRMVFEEPKTRRSRRAVDVPAFLLPYLVRQREAQATRRERCASWVDLDLVIDAGDGRPLNPDTLSSGWYRFLKRSGLPHIRFHDLRHAHATLMLLQGGPPQKWCPSAWTTQACGSPWTPIPTSFPPCRPRRSGDRASEQSARGCTSSLPWSRLKPLPPIRQHFRQFRHGVPIPGCTFC
jgi:integrase